MSQSQGIDLAFLGILRESGAAMSASGALKDILSDCLRFKSSWIFVCISQFLSG